MKSKNSSEKNPSKKNPTKTKRKKRRVRGPVKYVPVRMRARFYGDKTLTLSVMLVAMFGLILLELVFLIKIYMARPEPTYFRANKDQQIVAPIPLNEPGLQLEVVNDWIRRAISNAWNFNYVTYQDKIPQIKNTYFTERGFRSYQRIIEKNGDFNLMRNEKYIVSANLLSAPRIINQGVFEKGEYKGRYSWDIELEMDISFRNPDQRTHRTRKLKVLIIRASTVANADANKLDGLYSIKVGDLIEIDRFT